MTRSLILVAAMSMAIGTNICRAEYSEQLDDRYTQPEEFRKLFEELQTAVSVGDYEKFASLFHYPVRAFIPAEGKAIQLVDTIETPSELVDKIEFLFSEDSLAVMRSIDYEKTDTLWYGVNIPDGGVILADYCIASGECEQTGVPSIEVLYFGPPQMDDSR